MVRRHVLHAFEVGIAANDEDAARAHVKRIDPVLRRPARRQLERRLIDAALACDAAGHGGSPADVMRQAVKDLGGPRTTAPGRFPLWTVITTLATLALVAGAALYIATRPGPPARQYVRHLPPPTADAFAKGGTPLADAAIEKLLTEQLTTLVVDGNNVGANDRERIVRSLHAPEAILGKGKPLAKAWDTMLDAFEAAVTLSQAGQAKQTTSDMLRESVRELSEAFASLGLGYHLEAHFRGVYPIVQAYKVEQVVFVMTAGKPRRVLSLRRLDHLNSAWAVLGMHDEDMGDPTLHLDRIDVNVATFVLPVLAADAAYPLADQEWMLWDKSKPTTHAIADTVRREYMAALGADASKAAKIAALLVKRNDIIDQWRDKLGRRDIYFMTTDQLFVPQSLLDSLHDLVSHGQIDKVKDIDEQLAELEAPRIHARLNDMVAATVRRHEAQHGFDYDRDTELKYPDALQSQLGSPHDDEGNPRGIVSSARAELSGYLSQILNDPITPQAALWHLARQTFDRNSWGTGEYYAGLVVLEGIAKQLGADTSSPRYQRGLDRDRLAAFATVITGASDDKVRAAAKALWTELYGEPPTAIVDSGNDHDIAAL